MSRLIMRGHTGKEFKLVITQFRSPMSATINSAQTRRMMNHFPIRAGQPDIEFTAQFTSRDEKHDFQDFVREHQLNALDDDYTDSVTSSGAVTLMWPERNIASWTGYIVNMPVQEARFDYAPKVTFGVMLIKSLMSEQTFSESLGSTFDSIVGITIPPYVPNAEDISNWFQLPNVPISQQQVQSAVRTAGSVTSQIVNGVERLLGQ